MLKNTGYCFEIRKGNCSIIDSIRPAWLNLSNSNLAAGPFCRPEYIEACLKAFYPSRQLMLILIWQDKSLKAVLPLIESNKTFLFINYRILESPTSIHSNRFDIACELVAELEVFNYLWQALETLDFDCLLVKDVAAGSSLEKLLDLKKKANFTIGRWHSMNTPITKLTGNINDFPKCLGYKFESTIRRLNKKEKRLHKCGPLKLERIETADDPALETFYTIEANGWKGKNNTAIKCDPQAKLFYDSLAISASKYGYFCLMVLKCAENIIAMNYALTLGDKIYIPKTTYIEAWSSYSPGQFLFKESIKDSLQRGLKVFDFLGPDAEWKQHWTSDLIEHNNYYVFNNSLMPILHFYWRFHILKILRIIKRKFTKLQSRSVTTAIISRLSLAAGWLALVMQ